MNIHTSHNPNESEGHYNPSALWRYRLTVEDEPALQRRARFAIGVAIISALIACLAFYDMTHHRYAPLLDIGIGRLARTIHRAGWPGASLLSALELFHFALLGLAFSASIWFGATKRPPVLPQEELIFFRRQSVWVAANPLAIGMAGLVLGQILSGWGLGLVAIPVEVLSLSLIAGACWIALVPEARVAAAVFLDSNMGWGNRIILSGGLFRLRSRATISKDWLTSANACDFGGLEMLGGARSIDLIYMDDAGSKCRLHLRGISSDPEAGVLASILNTRFKRALTRETLRDAIRLNRVPPEANI